MKNKMHIALSQFNYFVIWTTQDTLTDQETYFMVLIERN